MMTYHLSRKFSCINNWIEIREGVRQEEYNERRFKGTRRPGNLDLSSGAT